MPRRARLVVPGIPWHIIQRGNNRSACFYADEDYHRYLDTLKEQAKKYDCVVHAYCLMTNHVHLLLTPMHQESAALLMKHLGQRYVQYINRTYKRSGTLWEGRFRSCLAQSEDYVLACYRYIELNPVRAQMVEHPAEYPWPSYRINGEGRSSEMVTQHEKYLRLGSTDKLRINHYRELFKAHLEPGLLDDIRKSTNGNYVLGDSPYIAVYSYIKARLCGLF
ncbi:MAG: transposase [Sulfuriflexus sp.]|nr:transposase [Sulfuriflexus sp.]